MLMSVVAGEAVASVRTLDDKQVLQQCMAVLRELFKEQVREWRALRGHVWPSASCPWGWARTAPFLLPTAGRPPPCIPGPVHTGCCNTHHRPGVGVGRLNHGHRFSHHAGGWKSKTRCRQVWCLRRLSSLACRWLPSPWDLTRAPLCACLCPLLSQAHQASWLKGHPRDLIVT